MAATMAKKDWTAKLTTVTFRCGGCKRAFEGEPDIVEETADPEQAYHPYLYYADCPHCTAKLQPQASNERALLKAHQMCTGPRTPEGIKASAENIKGHPTPSEALRTRFNAMKHGNSARTATYFPAKPGKYAWCETCNVDQAWCATQAACERQTRIFMMHHAAFEQRNPKLLTEIHGETVAAITATLQIMLQQVLGDGVVLRHPKVELSREGVPVTLSYEDAEGEKHFIEELHAHPLLKIITDFSTRLGINMSDLGMTPKRAIEEEESLAGNLGGPTKALPADLEAFQTKMVEAMAGARQLLANSAAATRADPVLVEHLASGAED